MKLDIEVRVRPLRPGWRGECQCKQVDMHPMSRHQHAGRKNATATSDIALSIPGTKTHSLNQTASFSTKMIIKAISRFLYSFWQGNHNNIMEPTK